MDTSHELADRRTSEVGRRNFLGAAAAMAGLGLARPVLGKNPQISPPLPLSHKPRARRLPREVWIATISQEGMRAGDFAEMAEQMLQKMEQVVAYQPDIICLPELFLFSNVDRRRPPVADVAESPLGHLGHAFADFARAHKCYIVYSTYTRDAGRYYNSAVLIDRQGNPQGSYQKMHPTIGELERGISPGPPEPPVFQTDFGVIGAQICFDIEWDDGWKQLERSGAEIVFWPSAFAGGIAVNGKAWQHRYVVVSSTRKDTSKICDISGQTVAGTGRWNHWVCAPVNLEKAFLHTWPYSGRFEEIQAKYGRQVRITNFQEEEWSIIESLSPEVRVADILEEFEIDTYQQLIAKASRLQQSAG